MAFVNPRAAGTRVDNPNDECLFRISLFSADISGHVVFADTQGMEQEITALGREERLALGQTLRELHHLGVTRPGRRYESELQRPKGMEAGD